MGDRKFPDADIPTRALVESLVREDATIDAAELFDVAGVLGMSDQQVRLCITRLVSEGKFVQEGRGRKAVLRATASMLALLEPDAEFVKYMYAQDRGERPWDGRWHLDRDVPGATLGAPGADLAWLEPAARRDLPAVVLRGCPALRHGDGRVELLPGGVSFQPAGGPPA